MQRDEKIKAELLAYEKSKPSYDQPPQDNSSNSDDDGMDYVNVLLKWLNTSNFWGMYVYSWISVFHFSQFYQILNQIFQYSNIQGLEFGKVL